MKSRTNDPKEVLNSLEYGFKNGEVDPKAAIRDMDSQFRHCIPKVSSEHKKTINHIRLSPDARPFDGPKSPSVPVRSEDSLSKMNPEGKKYKEELPSFNMRIYLCVVQGTMKNIKTFLLDLKRSTGNSSPHCGVILQELSCPHWMSRKFKEGQEYTLGTMVGQGGFGSVYRGETKCLLCKNNNHFAVKKIHRKKFKDEDLVVLMNFPDQVCKLYGVIKDDDVISIFMEEALGCMKSGPESLVASWGIKEILVCFHKLLKDLQIFHEHQWYLRDIKLENILLRSKDAASAVFNDFGSSYHPQYPLTNNGLTPIQYPPEWETTFSMKSSKEESTHNIYRAAWDTYQLGSVFFEIIMRHHLWAEDWRQIVRLFPDNREKKYEDLCHRITEGGKIILKRLQCQLIPTALRRFGQSEETQRLIYLVCKMLHPNPARRITPEKALEFFQGMEGHKKQRSSSQLKTERKILSTLEMRWSCHNMQQNDQEYVIMKSYISSGQWVMTLPVPLNSTVKSCLVKLRDLLGPHLGKFDMISHLGRAVHPSERIIGDCEVVLIYQSETTRQITYNTMSMESETTRQITYNTMSMESETTRQITYNTMSMESETTRQITYNTMSMESETTRQITYNTMSMESETTRQITYNTMSMESETTRQITYNTMPMESETTRQITYNTMPMESETTRQITYNTMPMESETTRQITYNTMPMESDDA
ncbi:hypothetical protein ScPMuIL_001416 [Solemya velum]